LEKAVRKGKKSPIQMVIIEAGIFLSFERELVKTSFLGLDLKTLRGKRRTLG